MLKNMKIRLRLVLSYAIIIVMTLVICVVAALMLQKVGDQLSGFYDRQFQTVNSAWAARRAVYAAQNDLFLAMMERDEVKTKEYLDQADIEAATMAKSIAEVRDTYQGDLTLVDQIEGYVDEAKPVRLQVMQQISAGETDAAYVTLTQQYIPLTDKIRANMIEISNIADQNAQSRVADGANSKQTAILIMVVLALVSVGVGTYFSVVISSSIRRPVEEIEQAAKNLSLGKLDSKITYEAKDELGSLAESMRQTIRGLSQIISDLSYLMNEIASGNFSGQTTCENSYVGDFLPILTNIQNMNNRLSDTMRQINESADQVSSGSEQVSSGAQALAQGATEQASSVQQLAASISEISDQVHRNATVASEASKRAGIAGDVMEEGNKQMEQMTSAMIDISHSSDEIGKIIKTIEDIAFQTNILALNAAVEAARAGAAGKGFAVVADEVRSLAGKSAEASKNTSVLIESSIHAVENGKRIAGETAKVISTAVEDVRQVITSMDHISAASVQQSDSIQQIGLGIDQISSVVQTNSATAEESAAASEELSAQSVALKNLVSRFKLKD